MKRLVLLLALLILTIGCSKVNKSDSGAGQTELKEETHQVKAKEDDKKNIGKSPLTGLTRDTSGDQKLIGVIIENHPDARPQHGLSKAEIVYDFEVESNLTRFLGLFYDTEADLIGPIRSARPYIIDTVMEYDGLLVRFGGSEDADFDALAYGIDEINGMNLSGPEIWRDNSFGREAPHDAYSSTDVIKAYIDKRDLNKTEAQPPFTINSQFTELDGEEALSLYLEFSGASTVLYQYDEKTKSYDRFADGEPMIDQLNDKIISPSNLILQLVPAGYMENGIHLYYENVGSGEGYLFTGGQFIPIYWSKDSRESPTSFTDEEGNEIRVNPGQTWIEVFGDDRYWEIN